MTSSQIENLSDLYPDVANFEPGVVDDLFALADLVELIQRHIRRLAEVSGMPAQHFFILEHLALNNGVAPLADLLVAVALPKQSATYMIDHLERDGLVKRSQDERDRRRLVVGLTKRGYSVIRKAFAPFYDTLLRATTAVSERERRAVRRGLKGVLAALESATA